MSVLQAASDVELAIPATSAFVRLARLNASALANDLGFTVDGVEELRIAVDEACTFLLEPEGPGTVHLRFHIDAGAIELAAERTGLTSGVSTAGPGELARLVLRATTDTFDWNADGSCRSLTFRKHCS